MSLLLETQELTKVFGTCVSVSEVSVKFEPGLIHAVIGENGAGKSTLMKLLFGLHQPTQGKIFVNGQPTVWRDSMDAIQSGLGMVQQHFSLVDSLSVIDNVMLGAERCSATGHLDRKGAISYLESLLPSSTLRLPWEEKVGGLTVGQKQRVEILKLLFRQAKILFLDEPTAVLTPQEIHDFFEVLRQLRKSGRSIVLITHKLNEVFELCDTYSVLRQGKLVARGNVKETTKEQVVEMMIGRKLRSLQVASSAEKAETVLDVKNISEVTQERGSLKGLSLNVTKREIVGIAGVDGSGQSHLVEVLLGLRKYEGAVQFLGQPLPEQTQDIRALGVGLIPEDRHLQGLWLEQSCHDNMIIGLEDGFLKNGMFNDYKIETTTSSWAKEFDVRASSLFDPVASLSGGNQQKVIFAREVSGRKPKFLICHQPTRGVDLGAIELIHKKILDLRKDGLTVLLISSELDELLTLSDRLYVFFEGAVSAEFSRSQFDRMKIGAAMTGVRT